MVSHLLSFIRCYDFPIHTDAIGTNNQLQFMYKGNVSITFQICHQRLFLLLSRREYSDWLTYIAYQNIKVALGGGGNVLIRQC